MNRGQGGQVDAEPRPWPRPSRVTSSFPLNAVKHGLLAFAMAADTLYSQVHRRLAETGEWERYSHKPLHFVRAELQSTSIFAALVAKLNEVGWIDELKHSGKGWRPFPRLQSYYYFYIERNRTGAIDASCAI